MLLICFVYRMKYMWLCKRCKWGISIYAKQYYYCEECYEKMLEKLAEITFDHPTESKQSEKE